MNKITVLFFVFVFILPVSLCAQDEKKLLQTLQKQENGIEKIKTLQELGSYYVFKPEEKDSDLNKSLDYINKSLQLSKKLNYKEGIAQAYIYYHQIFYEKGDKEKSNKYADAAIVLMKQLKCYDLLAEAYYKISWNVDTSTEKGAQKKLTFLKLGVDAYKKTNNRLKTADFLKRLGEQQYYMSFNEEALANLLEALSIYNSIGYKDLKEVYNLLGGTYTILGKYDKGVKYGLLAVKMAEESNDTSSFTPILYNRIGITYAQLNEHEKAIEYFEKGLKFAKKQGDTLSIIHLSTNIGSQYKILGNYNKALLILDDITSKYDIPSNIGMGIKCGYISIYCDKKNYKKAIEHCESALKDALANDADNVSMQQLYYFSSEAYTGAKQFDKAQYYLDKYYSTAKHGSLRERGDYYWWQFKLDSVRGNYLSAIKNYQTFKIIGDTLYSKEKTQQIADLEIKYQTDKKEKDIQLLSKQRQIEAQKTKQAKKIRNISFVGAGLLLIALVLIYFAYRNKSKLNFLLRKQQAEITEKNNSLGQLLSEKEWLLKEIHHRVKNNLQIIMSLLNSQAAYLKDAKATAAIKDSQRRVHSVSLIHKKLYQSDNLSTISMPVYIDELVTYISDSFDVENIKFDLKIIEVNFGVHNAVPIGLIINEAITNAIKYAYPQHERGVIRITLSETEDNNFELLISDNGVGLPEGFDAQTLNSLGINLMRGLAEDLSGTFEIYVDDGTVIKIVFEKEWINTHKFN